MNKRSIAKAFNEAPKDVWTTIVSEPVKLTNAFFKNEAESKEEIDVHIAKYIDTFLTKSVQKKLVGLEIVVQWPTGDIPFRPYVDRVKVFRLGNKYVGVIIVNHLAD